MEEQIVIEERVYNAPVSRVWDALTDKDKMKQWYFDIEEFKPEVGFEFQFTAGDTENRPLLHLCKITVVEKEKKLAYTWKYEGHKDDTLVTFELFEEGEKTRIRLTHTGIEKISIVGPAFAKENFEMGWKEIIGNSLRSYVENK